MTDISLPPSSPGSHPLLTRIAALRGRVRLILALFGIGILLASLVSSMFLFILADYLLHIPASARLFLLIFWLAGAGFIAWKYIIAPLSTRLTDQFLASRVENLHAELSDELMSAIHFLHAGTTKKNALAARHVDDAAAKVQSINFHDAVDFRHPGKSLSFAALAIIIVVAIAALNPNLAKIALSRWFSANPLPWPRYTTVSFDWTTREGVAPTVLPIGEQFVVRAKVTSGGYPQQKVWLSVSGPEGSSSNPMTYQANASTSKEYIYESTLSPAREGTMELRLSAGDDDEEQPVKIRFAPRPSVTGIVASITPPPYVTDINDPTKPAPPVNIDLLSAAGRAVQGAKINLHITSSKPLAADAGKPLVSLLDQFKDNPLPLSFDRSLESPNQALLAITANKKLEARAGLVDTDGFDNRVGGAFSIDVVPDAMPSVAMTDPRASVSCTPNALIKIAVQATDDLGLDGLKLVARKFDAKDSDPDLVNVPLTWSDRTADPAAGTTTGHAAYAWDLTPLNLSPGSRYTFYVLVQDNYNVDGKRHDWVKSSPLSLTIKTEADITKDARNRLNEIKERLKNLRNQQDQTKALVESIQATIAKTGSSTAAQRAQLADLAQTQAQEAATAASLAQRAAQVKTDLAQSRMAESEMGKLANTVAEGLNDVSTTNMPKASGDLKSASDTQSQDAKKATEQTQAATKEQTEALAKMDAMIDQLGAAGDFEAARAELRTIQEKQTQNHRDLEQISPQTLGRRPEDLPQDLKNRLNELSRQQDELKQRTIDWMNNAEKSAQSMQQSDPASAESLSRANDAGKQNNVTGNQESAANNIKNNQTRNAGDNQSSADRGLQAMMDELNQNEKRRLEELARQLRDLIQELESRKAVEVAIKTETHDAGPKATVATLTPLANRQGTNQLNTVMTQKKVENTRNAQVALPDIRDAVAKMTDAAANLLAPNQPNALDAEDKSIVSLDAAIEKLKKERDKVDSQLKEKQLDEYIKQYEAIRTDQTAIKKTSDDADAAKKAAPDHQLDNRTLMFLAGATTKQGGLVTQLDTLNKDDNLNKFEVVTWMNNQVIETMNDSKTRLSKAAVGAQLAAVQQTAIDQLTAIIEALKEEKKRESDFRQGGGNGGGQGRPPLVPPLAQLKMLKAMQNIVNGRTTSIDKGLQAATDTEKKDLQQQATSLSDKQTQIKTITEKMIKNMSR